jgi:hypothetical protein
MDRTHRAQQKRRYDRPVLRKQRQLADVVRGGAVLITDRRAGSGAGSF